MTEKGKNIPEDAVRPAPNAVVLPGGSYDFLALEKALEKAVDTDDETDRTVAVNEVLAAEQQNEARSNIAVPPGHEVKVVEDAQGNKVHAPVPIIEKGEAVAPEPTVTPTTPVTPAAGTDGDTKPKTGTPTKS